MSEENVAVIRAMLDRWFAGDLEGATEVLHPEIEWYEPPQQTAELIRRGREGVNASIADWTGSWDDYRYEVDEILDAGHDKVLVCGRQYGRGKDSGIEVSSDIFHLWMLRDGRAVEGRMFLDRAEALEAAGLDGGSG